MGGTTLSSYMGGYPAQQQAQQPQYWQQFLQNIYGGSLRQMSYQDAASLAFGYDPYGAALQAATQPRYTPPPMPPAAKPTAGPDAGVTAPAAYNYYTASGGSEGGGNEGGASSDDGGGSGPGTGAEGGSGDGGASGGGGSDGGGGGGDGERRGGRIGHSKDVRAAMLTARGMTPDEHARHRSPAVHPASLIPGIHVRSFATGGDVQPTDETGFDAYHGTPHEFAPERLVQHPTGQQEYMHASQPVPEGASVLKEFPLGRFRSDRIGTGEGAQAYGHGLYLARAKPVAEEYAANPEARYARLSGHMSPKEEFAHDVGIRPGVRDWDIIQALVKKYGSNIDFDEANNLAKKVIKNRGHLYHVRVNANPAHFLDWDKPLSEQNEYVQKVLQKFGFSANREKINQHDRALLNALRGSGNPNLPELPDNPTGKDIHKRMVLNLHLTRQPAAPFVQSARDLSGQFRKKGIPGIRYLDAMSRGPTGAPTYNHVIFDPSIIDIKHRYKRGGEVAPHDQTLPPNPHKHDTTRRSGGHVARALRLAHSLNPVPPGRLRP
jgi:hypothetical protein